MKSKIKSFESACKFTGRNPKALPGVSKLPKSDQEYHINNHKLLVIAEALVKEYSIQNKLEKVWSPDWNDSNQYKYENYHRIEADKKSKSGFRFSYSAYDYTFSYAGVGSRFVFPNSEIAIYFGGKNFEKHHLKTKLR